MKRTFAALAVAVFGVLCLASAGLSASNSQAPSANVDSIAVVTSDTEVVFQMALYDCPAGNLITVDWTANEPSRPDSGAAGGGGYGLSNGANVQYLTVRVNSSSFLAGERWIGSGTVNCGTILIPVSGSGQAKSLNGV
jgi:plastocyanin